MAGTRWWIIQSFLIPLLLYVIIVCLGYGFFLVYHYYDNEDVEPEAHNNSHNYFRYLLVQHHHHHQHKPFISSLLWKHITDMIWVNVYLPLFIHIPFLHQQQQVPVVVSSSSLLYRSNNRTLTTMEETNNNNDYSESMLHRIITTTTTPTPWKQNNYNNNNNQKHDKIYITLIFDRTVKNWNEYIYPIQIWMDQINLQQQQQQQQQYEIDNNDIFLLSALCPYIHPIQIRYIYRTDVIRNMTISTTNSSGSSSSSNRNRNSNTGNSSTNDSNHYRSLSTTDHNLIALLSDDDDMFIEPTLSSHLLLYIPNETTYFSTTQTVISSSTSSSTTTTTLVQISNEDDFNTLSYFGIMNPLNKHHIDDIASSTTKETVLFSHEFLDQIYNQYFLKCLHMVDGVDATVNDTTHSKTNHDWSNSDQKSLYYHRTFTIWYQSILNRFDSIYMEILEYQTPQYSPYVYKPWSFQSLLIPIQNKLHTLINDHIMEFPTTATTSGTPEPTSSSWLYSTNYYETYQRLQQITVTIQQLEHDMNDMKYTIVQNQSRILDITMIIFNLPMEQYLAIFGPLLFPLIIPLCITFVREYIRYRKYNNRVVVR